MEEVLVSVIMGVYNPNHSQLEKAVHSIIEQSFTNWEMILFDDGSSEKYKDEISELANLDSRIHCFRNEKNKGLASALNECISLTKGKYIARMDGDDISLKERFKKQVDFLNHNPEYAWVGCSAYLLSGEEIWGVRRMKEVPQAKDFLKHSPYMHPTVMFRREALESCQGYNASKKTRRCEDYELFIRLHKKAYQGYNINELLFAYREDYDAYGRRTLKNRFYEMQIRYWGFKELGILKGTTLHHVIRPMIGGLIPVALLYKMKKKQGKH